MSHHSRNTSHSSSSSTPSVTDKALSIRSSTSTAPTCIERPPFARGQTWPAIAADVRLKPSVEDAPRASMDSVESVVSFSDLDAIKGPADREQPEMYPSDACPTTPRQFQDLWPSTGKLYIRHDDSTSDGNMNLRVDARHTFPDGTIQKFTLFHLRMHNLKAREFVLRRHGRASGMDICRTRWKVSTEAVARPSVVRSLSSVLARSFHAGFTGETSPPHEIRRDGMTSPTRPSMHSRTVSVPSLSQGREQISVEFMNYHTLNLIPAGCDGKQRYDFAYWGESYSWKPQSRTVSGRVGHGYALYRKRDGFKVARILSDPLPAAEAADEEQAGGWVAPCMFWLSKAHVSHELGDIVVATALLAFVDNSIRRRFTPVAPADVRQATGPRPTSLRWLDEAWARVSRPGKAH